MHQKELWKRILLASLIFIFFTGFNYEIGMTDSSLYYSNLFTRNYSIAEGTIRDVKYLGGTEYMKVMISYDYSTSSKIKNEVRDQQIFIATKVRKEDGIKVWYLNNSSKISRPIFIGDIIFIIVVRFLIQFYISMWLINALYQLLKYYVLRHSLRKPIN